ncbi:MAG: hypothetical protein CSA62_11900 [Planctomycetota bacterium]|nr:MAG: hypothetical protein CSA62_11900 [Planctomycetota bacterium]
MFVRLWMTDKPVTMGPRDGVMDARDVMEGLGFRRIPVLDEERLVGIVTWGMIERLPAWDIDLSLGQVMHPDPITIDPYAPLDRAVQLMKQHKVGALPVVSKGKLVGILTESNIFEAVRRIIEADTTSASFVCFDMPDSPGCVPRVSQFIESFGLEIRSFVTHRRAVDVARRIVAMRVEGCNVPVLIEALWKKRYRVLHVGTQSEAEPSEA